MLEATKGIRTSSSILFVPRQVMLVSHSVAAMEEGKERRKDKESKKEAKKDKKNKKRSSETVEEGKEKPDTLALDRANGGAVVGKGKGRETLIQAIAAFLKSNGFSKTLAIFQAEAQIEVDAEESSFLKLEDVFSSFLGTSDGLPIASIDFQKPQDSGKVAISQEAEGGNINDASTQTHKKKKKRNNETDNETKNDTSKCSTDHISKDELEISKASGEKNDPEKLKAVENETEKKKRKHKSASNSLADNSVHSHQVVNSGGEENVDQVTLLPKPQEKDKKKKSKKQKMVGPCNEINEPSDCGKLKEIVEDKIEELQSLVNNSLELIADHKHDKKKKKLTENVEETETHNDVKSKRSCDLKSNGNALVNNQNREKKKKKGKSASENSNTLLSDGRDAVTTKSDVEEENVPMVDNNVDTVEKKIPNKRKRLPSEENGFQIDNEGAENNKEVGAIPKAEKPIHENKHKKRKVEESNGSSPAENSSVTDDLNKELTGHKLENGQPENNGKEGNTPLKSSGKGNKSSEPKTTINAFQRVKIEEVKFADKKLQDNSYWAKDGADSGYGAKAQEVLGQVRGRDFRHEKTKKKRGSYRGGQIDLQSHSVKFNYSDEE